MKSYNSKLYTILSVAAILRLAWVLWLRTEPAGDGVWYFTKAMDIYKGFGYINNSQTTAYVPIGYPGFLAIIFTLFSPTVLAAQIANIVLYVASIYFISKVQLKLFHAEWPALLSALILAVYPNHVFWSTIIYSEILYLFLISLAAFSIYYCRNSILKYLLAGIFVGFASLIKPFSLLLPACYIAYMFVFQATPIKTIIKNSLLIYVALFIVILPWSVRNYTVFHKFILVSTNGGLNLLIGNNPDADGGYDYEKNPYLNETIGSIPCKDEVCLDKALKDTAVKYIKTNPGTVLKSVPMKLFHLYRADISSVEGNRYTSHLEYKPALAQFLRYICQLPYMLICLLALIVVYKTIFQITFREKYKNVFLLYVVVFFYTFIYCIFFGASRFHFPVLPVFVILSSLLIYDFKSSLNHKYNNTGGNNY